MIGEISSQLFGKEHVNDELPVVEQCPPAFVDPLLAQGEPLTLILQTIFDRTDDGLDLHITLATGDDHPVRKT